MKIVPIRLGDVVKLKKPHPCGANRWEITKLGMDVGLLCQGCGRHVRLIRYDFDRRFRGYLSRSSGEENDNQGAEDKVAEAGIPRPISPEDKTAEATPAKDRAAQARGHSASQVAADTPESKGS